MFEIPGYQITSVLTQNKRYCILRATEQATNKKVIVKALAGSAKTPHEVKKLKREFEIGQKIDSPNTVKPLQLYNVPACIAIIFADDEGTDLEKLLPEGGFNVVDFFAIAMQLITGLDYIHKQRVIHKDLKPANIIFIPPTKKIKIIDFGSASQLKEENQTTQAISKLQGTIAYMSPEQTGRMNRSIDYRTDFYSLGITFYQLLCGKLPFAKQDSMALIHCQLSQNPTPVNIIKPGIPEMLGNIVSKLLMKNAEDRYQSIGGLLHDIKHCQQQWSTQSTALPFVLGQYDFSARLQISQKLYGREKEISTLLHTFDDTMTTGKPSVLAVAGYSGIGKSTLINEIQRPITLKNGRFLTGKFDQISRTIAYSAVIQALQSLIKQILAEDAANIEIWRKKIQESLGNNGQIIVELIPELALIIGTQPDVIALAPAEAKNRLNTVFHSFINALTSKDHPLVLFLDDLQWADSASLELIKYVTLNPDTKHFFFIAAYRDNEVSDTHIAIITLQSIRQSGVSLQQITLTPLDTGTVQHWIADSLNTSQSLVKSLAEIVSFKTQGNPFFVKMFLRSLDEEKLLAYSEDQHWQWDNEKIRQRQATDNVVNFILSRISQLPESAQRLLSLASCLGNTCSFDLLALISQKDKEQLSPELQLICDMSMISLTDEALKFAHDRIQEAAYSLITSEQKKPLHLFIGRLLQQHYNLEKQPEKIFEIIDHLNISAELITDENEKLLLIQLNLKASKKVKNAAAYSTALKYVQHGIVLLNRETSWESHYELTFELYKELAELQYLNSDFEASERTIMHVIHLARTNIEKAEMYNLLVIQKTMLTEDQLSIQFGKTALALLGIVIAEDDLAGCLQREQAEIERKLGDRAVKTLIDLPEMIDPQQRTAFKLLASLMVPTIVANYPLYCVAVAKGINLALDYGHIPEASTSYIFYAGILCSNISTLQRGYEFGLLAIALAIRHNSPSQECKVKHVYSTIVHHWFNPLKSSKAVSDRSFERGLESGELQYAGYSRYSVAIDQLCSGENLSDLSAELAILFEFCNKTKNQTSISHLSCIEDAVEVLLGRRPLNLRSEYVQNLEQRKDYYFLGHDLIYKSQVLYLFGQYDEALRCTFKADDILAYVSAHYVNVEHNFYKSLSLAAIYPGLSQDEQLIALQKLAGNQAVMSTWAKNCQANFHHKLLLVSAEIARIQSNSWEASKLYEEAIAAASKSEFIQDQAIANELAAKFWLANNNETFARTYVNQALMAYQTWGAKAKIDLFKKEFAKFIHITTPPNTLSTSTSASAPYTPYTTTTNTSSLLIDMENVIRASQVFSRHIELKELLYNMMQIIIQTAGAQKGVLLLNNNGVLTVEAEYLPSGEIKVLQTIALKDWEGARNIVEYVRNTNQTVTLNKATEEKQFCRDPYIESKKPKSILCMPILNQEKLKAILYIENNLADYAFPQNRVAVLSILASQMAICLENANYVKTQLAASERIAEEQRARLREAEDYKDRLTKFIAGLCHEARNPLHGASALAEELNDKIKLMRQLITQGHPIDPLLIDSIEQIQRDISTCLKHQQTILDNNIDATMIKANGVKLDNRPFDPKEIITEALAMGRVTAQQKNLTINVVLPPSEIMVSGDVTRFKQIILNLLGNAIKFTSQGSILIELRILEQTEQQTLLSFIVEDTGIGMSADDKAKLFKLFSQANISVGAQYGGSGLGLFITKELVTLMHGTIDVESEIGKGSRFELKMRFDNASLKAEKRKQGISTSTSSLEQSGEQKPLSTYKVLIVEDNLTNQAVLKRFLEKSNCTYLVANNGKEAVILFQDSNNQLDVILMDIQMPVMDGLAATREIRRLELEGKLPRIPIIGLSGNAQPQDKETALAAGMDDYLHKPITREKVYEKIAFYGQQKKAQPEKKLRLATASP